MAQHGKAPESDHRCPDLPEPPLDARSRAIIQTCIDELSSLLRGSDDIPEAPFPLTDLQQAYFVGEQGVGHLAAPALYIHEYGFPAHAAPDPARLADALNRMRRVHPVLRLRISADGTQSFASVADSEKNAPPVTVCDLSHLNPAAAREELGRLRDSIPADIPDHAAGQPFLLRLVYLPEGSVHLQTALRLTAFDGVTIQLFFAELEQCYANPEHQPQAELLSFEEFVREQDERLSSPAYRNALRHWEERLDSLPAAPDLPRAAGADVSRATSDGDPASPRQALHRSGHRVGPDAWKGFQRHAAEAGLSPGAALFGLYVECLLRWSGDRAGSVTVLASHRAGGSPGADRLWGCGSTTVLVDYTPREGSFVERCQAYQERLYTALEARDVSGVEVGRMLNQRRGESGNPVPFVFSSGLDLVDGITDGFRLGLPGAALVYSAISTPEVLLDHQVYEQSGDLVCNFDHDPTAFPPGLVDDLAAYHRQRLLGLAADPRAWTRNEPAPLPDDQLSDRRRANDTAVPGLAGELHEAAIERLRRRPDAPAVADGDHLLRHGELDRLSGLLATRLRAAGVGRDPARPDLVAVRVPKSWQQSVAVLGVLRAGGAYLPIAPNWPASRVAQVLRQSCTAAVVVPADTPHDERATLPTVAVPGLAELTEADAAADAPDGLGGELSRTAYVIYTSGSTGTPKGAVISHGAAANTLRDLVDRLELTPRDKVLAVSSLAFDLSVFDVFGVLGAGGCLVVPPERDVPDPESWGELCRSHGVTVWNSVPALLQVTLEYFGARAAEVLGSLRLIMLSGDWIPLPLLDRIAEACPSARVIAMGGATEASIWSNHFWTEQQPDGWSSVPYGFPLANQTMHVLDRQLGDVPVWVPGDLYIGGAGVAEGYHNEPELTKASFLTAPATGERLYRTGDRARYRPGGILEFLGREDDQVKIGGHRIELGEIETRLAARPEVETAVALVAGAPDEPCLAAFVSPAPGGDPDRAELRAHLAAELPSYMVPSMIQVMDAVPLSSNGKVDRKALLGRLDPAAGAPAGTSGAGAAPRTAEEARLLELWRDLLGAAVRGVTDDFFALGGNSLLAVRLFHRIKETFGRTLPLAALMRGRTIAEQAAQLGGGREDAQPSASCLVPIRDAVAPDSRRHLVLVHPVGGDVLCYEWLVRALEQHPVAAGTTVHGLRAAGLSPGEHPPPDMAALVASYGAALLEAVPEGEFHLVGWSMGGTIAVSLTDWLRRRGRVVASVMAIDSFTGAPEVSPVSFRNRVTGFFSDLAQGADVSTHVPERLTDQGDPAACLRSVQDTLVTAGLLAGPVADEDLLRLFQVYADNSALLEAHEPGRAPGGLFLLRARSSDGRAFPGLVPLEERLAEAAKPCWVDGDHHSVMAPEGADLIARLVAERLTGHRPDEDPYFRSALWC
ncbi:amino acid adenylation domain-containing protein [Streptomyces sp. NPDC101166]|uniref:non-ribosomal peptide synthetase n=1 Tax=Streptomyces sp. NPDC101166 TaxID=3366120 RepID=UPI003827CA0E